MQMPSYNTIDILFAILVTIGLIQGIRRGLSGEISRLLGTVISVWAGWHFYRPLGNWLLRNTRLTENDIYAVSFFICLVGVFISILLLRLLLRRIMEVSIKGTALERLGGAVAGIFRMFLLCVATIFFLNLLPIPYLQNSIQQESFCGGVVTRQIPVIYTHVQQFLPFLPPPSDKGSLPLSEPAYDPSKEIPASDPYEADDSKQDDL